MSGVARVYAAVAAGGALGALLRGAISLPLLDLPWAAMAAGTLLANTVGAFAIGAYAALAGPGSARPHGAVARHFWMTGLLGGFTTFSIFSLELLVLLTAGLPLAAVVHLAVSVPAWLLAVWGGYATGRRRARRQPPG